MSDQIPPFHPDHGYLPPGIHVATWGELLARYGYTAHRLQLLAGLKAVLDTLRIAGCNWVYINGSFVTNKEEPGDFDACWEMEGVDFERLARLDPVLLTWDNRRAAQKAKYHGELFIAESFADDQGNSYLAFFQQDKQRGDPKGIVAINLGDLP